MSVNDAIRRIWLKTGMSQQELAERINEKYPDDKISVAGVSKIMSGAADNPTHKTLEKIAWGLGVDISDFFNDDARVTYKLALNRLETLTPEVVDALSDKTKFGYLLFGLSVKEAGLSLTEIEHILDAYKTLKVKIGK